MSIPNAPRTWTARQWWDAVGQWDSLPAADGAATITPARARVGIAGVWRIRVAAGPGGLPAGARITMEIPIGWRTDHPPIADSPATPSDRRARPELPVDVTSDASGVRLQWRLSWLPAFHDGFWLLDIVVADGRLPGGEGVAIVLGDPNGRRVQPPTMAQRSVFRIGVDSSGGGDYGRLDADPVVDVLGGSPERLRVIAPATVRSNEPFELFIQAQDGYGGNPVPDYQATVELRTGCKSGWIPDRTRLGAERAATKVVSGALLEQPGVHTVEALAPKDYLAGRSNPIAVDWAPDDWQIYFGDLHGHCALDGGVGSVDEYFAWARHTARLDFSSLTVQASGRRRAAADPQTWISVQESVRRCHEDKRFVAFLGYEWGAAAPDAGKCVYYLGDEGSCCGVDNPATDTPEKLWEQLRQGPPALAVTSGIASDELACHDDQVQPLLEIYSNWGYREQGPTCSAQSALAAGCRIGFAAGSDTPFGRPGAGIWPAGRGGGLTAVLARERTREQLFASLRRRRTYATTGARILLWFGVDDLMMGQSGRVGSMPVLHARICGDGPLERVEIVKNNNVLLTRNDEGPELDVQLADRPELGVVTFYYVRVTQRDGHMAWSSPIWVKPRATQIPTPAHRRQPASDAGAS